MKRRQAAHFKRQGNIRSNRHVGVKCVGLENHRQIARLRRQGIHLAITNEHAALVGRFKPCDDPQQGGFAATRRTKDREKFAIPYLHRDITQNLRRTELLRNVPKHYPGHEAPSNPITPGGIVALCFSAVALW